MLNKITLIIPTHNRHSYLTRVLNYYEDVGMNILIADSSKKKYPNVFKYDVEYIHYPNYSFFKKMNDLVQKINTPFVFMCADDDFIIPSAIEKCIDFLEKNSDFASVQGYYASFINTYNSIYFFSTYPSLRNYVINANTPEERVKHHMSKYMQIFYSIHKTSNIKKVFSLTPLKNLNLIELTIGLISIINGKHKVLPFLYCIRETIPNSASVTTERLESIVNNPKMSREYNIFIDSISNYLSESFNYTKDDSKKIILESIESFLKVHLPNFSGNRIKISPNLLQKLNRILIKQMRPVFPSVYNKIFFKNRQPQYSYSSSIYRKEFKKIKNHIKKHSKDQKIVKRLKEIINNLQNLLLSESIS